MLKNKLSTPLILILVILILELTQCTPERTQDATMQPNAYITVNVKKNGQTDFSELQGQKSITLGTNNDSYKESLLIYNEIKKPVSIDILWSLKTKEGAEVKLSGLSYGKSQNGFLITINQNVFVPLTERKEYTAFVSRKNTILSKIPVFIDKYTPPTLQSLTLQRKSDKTTTSAHIGETIDLATVFDIIKFPQQAVANNFKWQVTNPAIGTIAEGTTIFTPLTEGIANITVSTTTLPLVISSTAGIRSLYVNKSIKITELHFPTQNLPSDQKLIAWHQYKNSSGTIKYTNLGLIAFNSVTDTNSKIKTEVTSDNIVVSAKVLTYEESKLILSLESVSSDPVAVATLLTPTQVAIMFAGTLNSDNGAYPLTFLNNSKFEETATNGTSSSVTAYTPSDNPITTNNDHKGIWFVKDSNINLAGMQPTASINLPELASTGNWIYEGWYLKEDNNGNVLPISLGKFFDPTKADVLKYYYDGQNTPKFPGEDLLKNRPIGQVGFLAPDPFPTIDVRYNNNNKVKVAVTLEKSADLFNDNLKPNFLKLLETKITQAGIANPKIFEDVMIPSAKYEIVN